MSASTNALVQDARALLVSTRKYQTQLAEGGINEMEITEIETAIAALETQDNAYENSKNARHTKTAAQNEQMANARVLVKKFRTAAKVLFMDDEPKMKEFHVGQAMPRTVREMVNELFYLNETAGRYSETLLTRGIKTADMQALTTCHTQLAQIDGEQEAARLAQLTTRDSMNVAVDDLKMKLFRIRKTAEIVFINDKSILQEFRTTIPHSKSATKTEATGPTETGTNP